MPIEKHNIYEHNLHEHMLEEEKRLSKLEGDIEAIGKKVDALETSITDLVTAWKTANGVVSFVKSLASVATAVVAIVAFFKLGWIKI